MKFIIASYASLNLSFVAGLQPYNPTKRNS
jgi:hypothetical protein